MKKRRTSDPERSTREDSRVLSKITELEKEIAELKARQIDESSNRLLSQLTGLIDLANELSTIESHFELCRQAIEKGQKKLGFGRLGIWLFDENDPMLLCGRYGTDSKGKVRDETGQTVTIDPNSEPWCYRGQHLTETFVERDVKIIDFDNTVCESGEGGTAFLWDGNENIGILKIDNLITKEDLSESDWRIFALYASILGYLIARKRARSKIQEQSQMLALRNSVAQGTTGGLSPKDLAGNLLNIVKTVVPTDAFFLNKYDEDTSLLSFLSAYDTIDGQIQKIEVSGDSYYTTKEISQAAETKQPVVLLRENPELESAGFARSGEVSKPSASLLFIPMISGERVIGIMSVQSYTPNAYTQTHMDTLSAVARQASPALEVALLGMEISTREQADRKLREQLIHLVEISNILSLSENTDEMCRQAITLGRERLDFDRLSISFVSENDPETVEGTFGVDDNGSLVDFRSQRSKVEPDCGLYQILAEKKPSVVTERMIEEPNRSCWQFTQAAAAVWDGEQIIGVIQTDNLIKHRSISKNQIELLRLYGLTLGMLCLRKKTEEALRKSDAIYRSAIEKAAGVPYQLRYSDCSYLFIGEGLENLIEVPSDGFTLDVLEDMIQESIIAESTENSSDIAEYSRSFKNGKQNLFRSDFRIITPSGREKWLSDIAVPIIDEKTGKVTGSLGVLQDITVRKRAEEELRENNERLTVLNKVAKLTLESSTVDEVCDRILRVIRESMPCEAFILDLYDVTANKVYAIKLYDTVDGEFREFEAMGHRLDPRGPMSKVIRERKTVRIHREQPGEESQKYAPFGSEKPSVSLIYTPLIAGDRVLGFISVQSYDFFAYTERDESLLGAIAQQTGLALDSILLSTEIREREQEERKFSRQLAKLVEVTNELASAETVNDLCQKAALSGHAQLGFDRIGIWFIDFDEPEYAIGSYGIDEKGQLRDETERRIKVDKTTLMGRVLSGNDLICQENVPLFNDSSVKIGDGTQATATIWDGEKIIGCISIDNYINKKRITEHQCELLRLFASALGNLVTSKRASKELQDIHGIYREAIQTAQGVPYLLDYAKAKYDFIGSGCEEMLGLPPEKLSLAMMDILVKESIPTRIPVLDPNEQVKSFVRGDIDRYKADIRIVTPQGEEKWLSDCSVPIQDPRTEKVIGSIGILQDITDRKRVEEALRESELRFRGVAETTRSAIFVSQDQKFTYVNPAVEEITGYSQKELLDMDFWEIVHPAFQEEIQQRGLARLQGKEVPNRYECKILAKDGKEVWLDEAVSVIELEGKRTVITAAFDITEKKRIEEEREALTRLAQALTAPLSFREIGLLVARESRKLFQYDAFWFDIFDPVKRILPGTYAEDTPPGESHPVEVKSEPQEITDMNAEVVFDSRRRLINRTEEMSSFSPFGFSEQLSRSLIFVPIRWQEKAIGIVSVQSYTSNRYGEKDLNLLQSFADQCGGAVHRVQTEERIRSASRLEATATLAGGVAHDFNNLMVAVLGNAELVKMDMEEDEDTMELQPLLDDIITAAQKAGHLAQQMLAFARGGKYRPVVMNINETIKETLSFQKRVFPPAIDIQYNLSPDLWNLNADPTQMSQIIMNLCLNAVEALGEKGKIIIRTNNVTIETDSAQVQAGVKPGKYVLLVVEDTGPGMSPEVVSKIFEPFYTTKFQGRGLGLAAVYGIVKNHEGHVNVRSLEKEGTAFEIYLPITESKTKVFETDANSLPTGTETILIVDDEGSVIRATQALLNKLGYNILESRNGKEAIDLIREYKGDIHLTILDMGMPVMSGAEAYEILLKERPNMQILICSGYDYSHVTKNILGMSDGAISFLQKPFNIQDLAKKVRALLD